MAFKTKDYDPAGIVMTIGNYIIEGYASGTFVSAERNEDSFTLSVGVDGEAARAKSNNRSGRVTFTLLQTSSSNDALTTLYIADEAAGNGVGPLLVKDLNGTTLCAAETAWVMKPATIEFGQEIGEREWVIETGYLVLKPGGANVLSATAS